MFNVQNAAPTRPLQILSEMLFRLSAGRKVMLAILLFVLPSRGQSVTRKR